VLLLLPLPNPGPEPCSTRERAPISCWMDTQRPRRPLQDSSPLTLDIHKFRRIPPGHDKTTFNPDTRTPKGRELISTLWILMDPRISIISFNIPRTSDGKAHIPPAGTLWMLLEFLFLSVYTFEKKT
jgi:hypothetical protein